MEKMKCEICSKTSPRYTLFRVNNSGEPPAIWRCKEHLNINIEPQVLDLIDDIDDEEDN
jgi:hypothetical protein